MKPWYKSKTIWVNGIAFAAAILSGMASDPAFAAYVPQIMMALSVVNIGLRIITKDPIE